MPSDVLWVRLGSVNMDTVEKVEIVISDHDKQRQERFKMRPALSEILNLHDFEVSFIPPRLDELTHNILSGTCATNHEREGMGILQLGGGRRNHHSRESCCIPPVRTSFLRQFTIFSLFTGYGSAHGYCGTSPRSIGRRRSLGAQVPCLYTSSAT